jgi:hypothetical protein
LKINDILAGNFTVIAHYAGGSNQTTFRYIGLPCNQLNIPEYAYSAPIIRGPPAYNPRILDSFGNAITGPVKVGQQIQISYTLANGLNCAQPFAYLVQIQDHNGMTISLSWITGTLLAGKSFDPAQSWTPQYNDTYTAQIFTWQSLENPNALVPPVSVSFDVKPNPNFIPSYMILPKISSACNTGFVHIIKKENSSPACVKPDTAQKLIERGWAKILVTKATFGVIQSNMTQQNLMANLGNETGIVNWKNQTYYFETPNYTKTSSGHPAQILFHDVIFTLFPSSFGEPPLGGCEGMNYLTDTKFSDGTSELLPVFVGSSSCGYDYIPIKLSTHTNPQAGLTVYDGKMKLLTSVESK